MNTWEDLESKKHATYNDCVHDTKPSMEGGISTGIDGHAVIERYKYPLLHLILRCSLHSKLWMKSLERIIRTREVSIHW